VEADDPGTDPSDHSTATPPFPAPGPVSDTTLPTTPPELTDGRIRVRPWRIEDVDWLTTAGQDPDVQRWTRLPTPYTRADAEHFVGEVAPRAWDRGEALHAAVTDESTGDGLGAVGLVLLAGEPTVAEAGYYTAAHRRRRGVAAAALDLLVEWTFTRTGVVRVELHVDPRNAASAAVAARCGFVLEGVLRSRTERHGERRDVAIHARLRP